MSFTSDLFKAVATLLSTANVGTYSPTSAYAANVTAIVAKKLPATPDSAIALTFYPVSDDATLSDSVVGCQVMTRAGGSDSGPVDALSDSVFGVLQSLPNQQLTGGIWVQLVERRSGTSLGHDDLNRWMRADTYYFKTYWPAAHRL